jgi:hypothetical protein
MERSRFRNPAEGRRMGGRTARPAWDGCQGALAEDTIRQACPRTGRSVVAIWLLVASCRLNVFADSLSTNIVFAFG